MGNMTEAVSQDIHPVRFPDRGAEVISLSRYACAGALLVLAVLAVANFSSIYGFVRGANGERDFLIFYSGAKIYLAGHGSQLYDLAVQAQFQARPFHQPPLPFDHPAYELLLFLPLGFLSSSAAYETWTLMNVVMLTAAAAIVAPHLPHLPRPVWLWILAMVACFPVAFALGEGQDSILALLLIAVMYAQLKRGKDDRAGLALAAMLFKFPIVLPFLVPFVFSRRWKFIAGFAGGAAFVTGLSVLLTGFAGAQQYVRLLVSLLRNPETGFIIPQVMPNARGFVSAVFLGTEVNGLLFDSIVAALTIALIAPPIVMCLKIADVSSHNNLRSTDSANAESFDLWFGLCLTSALLASPHLFWYDLTPMLVAVLIAANALLANGRNRISWTAIAWGLGYACALPAYLALWPGYYFVIFCVLVVFFSVRGARIIAPGAIVTVN